MKHAPDPADPFIPDNPLTKRLEARIRDQFARDLLKGTLNALTPNNVTTRA